MAATYNPNAEPNDVTDNTKCPCCDTTMTLSNLALGGSTVSADAECPTCGAKCVLDFSVTSYYGLTKRITPPADHAAGCGARCPACASSQTTWQGGTWREQRLRQLVTCDTCGATWRDVFTLSGYENLELGGKS